MQHFVSERNRIGGSRSFRPLRECSFVVWASLHASTILTTGIARPPGPDCRCVFSEAFGRCGMLLAKGDGGSRSFRPLRGCSFVVWASLYASAILTTGIARPPGPDCGYVFSEAFGRCGMLLAKGSGRGNWSLRPLRWCRFVVWASLHASAILTTGIARPPAGLWLRVFGGGGICSV